MPTYVALLRAINLGARRKFPKADVQRVVEATGATDVAVHLNTGNVRLTSRQRSTGAVRETLERAFVEDRGFDVAAHYVTFMREVPSAEAVALVSHESDGEVAVVRGRAVHLMLDGKDRYHKVKLPAAVDRAMGVWTNRNLTVVWDLGQRWGLSALLMRLLVVRGQELGPAVVAS